MYKNIVFDLGGVVVDFDPRGFLLERFCNKSTENKLYGLTFGSPLWQQLDAGTVTQDEAERQVMELARSQGLAFEAQAVLDDWPQMLRTRHQTVELMKRLKKLGYNIFYLSNISSSTLDLLQQRDFWPLFDGGLASCEVHINKPDPRIFEAFMRRCGLAYDSTIFVDDNKVNAQAAFDLGITGIHYKGHSSFVKALGACGIHVREHGKAQPHTR